MVKTTGPWALAEIEGFLGGAAIPLRLTCVRSDGYPLVVSLWYHYRDGVLQCVSHRNAFLVKVLRENPKLGFEVAPERPPYHGVRGTGDATLTELGESGLLESLLDRYLGGRECRVGQWLLSRKEDELVITIAPRQFTSWDYRQRMADVVDAG